MRSGLQGGIDRVSDLILGTPERRYPILITIPPPAPISPIQRLFRLLS